MAALVTAADVLNVTGITVTDAQILQAQAVIALKSGRDLDAADLWTNAVNGVPFGRDQRLIRSAIAYQAAWLTARPDAFTAVDVEFSNADGASQRYTASGLTLAPLAKSCLRRLSWARTRSVHIDRAMPTAPFDRRGDQTLPHDAEFYGEGFNVDSLAAPVGTAVVDTDEDADGWLPL